MDTNLYVYKDYYSKDTLHIFSVVLLKMKKESKNIRGKIKFENFYQISLSAVKTIGINLMPDKEWASKYPNQVGIFFVLYNFFWFINGIFLLTSLSGILIIFMGDLHSVEFLKSLTAVMTGFGNYYKGYLMSRYQNEIRVILRSLKYLFETYVCDQERYEVQKLLKNLLRMKRAYLIFYTSMLLGTFIPEVILYSTTGQHSNLNWTPFEINSVFRFIFNFIWLVWIAFAFCLNGFGADFVLFSSITMLTLQFEVYKRCKNQTKH